MNQRFYIVPYPVQQDILDIIVESSDTLRTNNDMTESVIKLPKGDQNQYEQLQPYQEYTYEQILIEMAKPEWQGIEEN